MKTNEGRKTLLSYFQKEKKLLAITTVTGLIYNIAMAAVPWFEGQLAQYLFDVLRLERQSRDLITLSILYVAVVMIVQGARALKRLYVRKFANQISLLMKESIFHHLVHQTTHDVKKEDIGSIMTKAVSDAEDCAEGMRKFVTEIFDTGVVMIAYLVMLVMLDWRLTLIVIVFPPVAYLISNAVKKKVSAAAFASKKSQSRLNDLSVDAGNNALTYRIYGEETNRRTIYEAALADYEKKQIVSGIWQNSPQPIYYAISAIGVIPILYLGGRNVLGVGWIAWSIASFSSYLSCFMRLAAKSSHASKLFNAIQKAEVSWQRIEGYLIDEGDGPADLSKAASLAELQMINVSFAYDHGGFRLKNLNLMAKPGEIIGITGKVASGKSTFGKIFLGEEPYEGMILYSGKDIRNEKDRIFAYSGHDHELFTGTVEENITFGRLDEKRFSKVMREAQLEDEVERNAIVGTAGNALSGGQQARIALARALYSDAPVLILDDPFSSVDKKTEQKIFHALKEEEKNRIILLISHRLSMFPMMDQIVFLDEGTMVAQKHEQLMKKESYARLYETQRQGGENHA